MDQELCDKARKEYTDWLREGYKLGKLGLGEKPLQATKHNKRKKELEKLKAAVRVFLDLITKISAVLELLCNKDNLITDKFRELLEMVKSDNESSLPAEKTYQKAEPQKSSKNERTSRGQEYLD